MFAKSSANPHAANLVQKIFRWIANIECICAELTDNQAFLQVLKFSDFESPLIVDSDASSVAFGSSLHRKKNIKRSTQFNTFWLISAVFALKKSKVYMLSSKPFLGYSGH